MAYTPTVWKDDPDHSTPIDAANLNKLENGLQAAAGVADSASTAAAAAAPLASPAFTGNPTAPTPSVGDSDTSLATTAFVAAAVAAGGGGGSGGSGAGIYGDGSDGSVTFNGSSTILGVVPSSSVYTLTRPIFCTDITINSGVTIKPNGYHIFHTGTLTNNGSILWNGNSASAGTAGAAIFNSTASINNSTSPAVGMAGGNGGFPTGSAGGNQSGNYSLGGNGGTGGTGLAGAAAGTAGTGNPAPASVVLPRTADLAALGQMLAASAGGNLYRSIYGGAGGSGAGGDTTGGFAGGAGGGGGGVIVICGKAWAGTGVVQARGGTGATPGGGNAGGGGGGGGGAVVIVSGSVSGGAITGQTIDANGGAGGTKTGTGTNGTAGSNGTVILVPNGSSGSSTSSGNPLGLYNPPTGITYETIPRQLPVSIATRTQGTLYLTAIWLPVGTVVSNISYFSATNAAGTPTHWWFGLWDSSLNQLAVTADQTTAAWTANTQKTLPIATTAAGSATSFTTTYPGIHYVGFLMAASVMVNQYVHNGVQQLNGMSPTSTGTSTTGLTTPPAFPSTATTIAPLLSTPWAGLG